MTSNTTPPPADAGQLDQAVRPASEAPRFWHCNKHGHIKPPARGCPDCMAELRRWKSTHAPRIEALEGLLHTAQHEAHAGREAIATLASERAANQALTNEIERLQARLVQAADKALTYAESYDMAVARCVLALDYMHPEQKRAFHAAWAEKRAELRALKA